MVERRGAYEQPKRVSRSARAGLTFPVGQVHRKLRKQYSCQRVAKLAPIYMTGVLEYTITEVLEGAGVLARLLNEGSKVRTVTPRILRLVISNDDELNEVFKGAIFAGSGGGGSISKKHRHKVRGTFETSDEEVEVVEVKKKKIKGRGRKGDHESSRAKKGSRDEEEDSDDSVVVEETRGSTRETEDGDLVRRKDQSRTSNSAARRKSRAASPESEPEVDPHTFAECKLRMKPVKKQITEFGADIDPGKSSEVQLSNSKKCLIAIGNHIESLLVGKSKEDLGTWRFNLWYFVSNFNPLSSKDLYQMYQVLRKD